MTAFNFSHSFGKPMAERIEWSCRYAIDRFRASTDAVAEARAKDDADPSKTAGISHTAYLLSRSGADLITEAAHAKLAGDCLAWQDRFETAEKWVEQVQEYAMRELMRLSRIDAASRSTSVTSNLYEDAQRAFWAGIVEAHID